MSTPTEDAARVLLEQFGASGIEFAAKTLAIMAQRLADHRSAMIFAASALETGFYSTSDVAAALRRFLAKNDVALDESIFHDAEAAAGRMPIR